MPKASPIQTAFNAGEWGPLLEGRVDLSKYFLACRKLENFVCLAQGPAVRRPGTRFVAEIKDSSKAVRLIPFEFNVEQAYILEFGDQYMRIFRDHGRVESGGSPVEVTMPYLEAELFEFKFAQSADVLYLTHPNHAPRKLSRTSHVDWTIEVMEFKDGPYLPINDDEDVKLASGATTGTGIALTATGGDVFVSSDVGRSVRLKVSASDWGWGRIASVTDARNATWDIVDNVAGTSATEDWRLGLWSETTGYPAAVTFFEDRLTFGGVKEFPLRLDGSRTGDYQNFTPSDFDGTVVDDHAIAFTLNANNVNVIRWLVDDEKGLFAGTVGGEWVLRVTGNSEAISAANPPQAKRSTAYGSADVMPVKAGRSTLFLQRANRELRELAFVFEDDGFRAPEMTLLANHIGESGIRQLAYQQEPHSIVWAVRNDGALLGLTFEREQDVVGWHRHLLGGFSDAAHTNHAKVESVATIPLGSGIDCECDELWIVVQRSVNGAVLRSIEYLETFWDAERAQADAFFIDSGLTYEGAPATVLSGLDHLEGEEVAILADGATHPKKTVSSGQVSLERPASKAQVGLSYVSTLQTMPIEAGSADGTAQGKTKRIHRVIFRVYQTLGGKAGPDGVALDPIKDLMFRDPAIPMDDPPTLIDGDASVDWPGGYEGPGSISYEQDLPFPVHILAIMPHLITQDR